MGMTLDEAIEHGKEQLEIFGGDHKEFIETSIEIMRKYQQIEKLFDDPSIISNSAYSTLTKIVDIMFDVNKNQEVNDENVDLTVKNIYTKDDMVAMLEELKSEFEEKIQGYEARSLKHINEAYKASMSGRMFGYCGAKESIQEKIDKLKGEEMIKLTRKQVIDNLEKFVELRLLTSGFCETELFESLIYAISSLKTDLKYDLIYEGEEIYTKADMVAMLKELKYDLYSELCKEIHGKEDCPCVGQTTSCLATFRVCDADEAISRVIQQKINSLEDNKYEKK